MNAALRQPLQRKYALGYTVGHSVVLSQYSRETTYKLYVSGYVATDPQDSRVRKTLFKLTEFYLQGINYLQCSNQYSSCVSLAYFNSVSDSGRSRR